MSSSLPQNSNHTNTDTSSKSNGNGALYKQALIALLITNLIWGAASPIIKFTLQYIPPFTFLFLRFLIVGWICLPIVFHTLAHEKVSPKDYINLFILGLFSQAAIVFVFLGIDYSTALDSTIIGISASVFTVYAGHYFYKEKIHHFLKLGLILASLGTLVVIVEPIMNGDGSGIDVKRRVIGNIHLMLYNLTWVLYLIWSKYSMGERSKLLKKSLSFIHLKPMTKNYSPILITITSFYVGLIVLLPFAFLEQFGHFGVVNTSIISIPWQGVAGLLYMAIFSSIVAYSLNQWALEHARVADVALYAYLGPIFAFPVAYFLLKEVPNSYMILGGILILLGVVIAEKADS